MSAAEIPYMEKIVVDFLVGRSPIEAIVGNRVATKTPRSLDEPWVRVNLLDNPPVTGSTTDHLIASYLQIDCYAGKKGDQILASSLARAVRAAFGDIDAVAHEGATVTGAKVHGSKPLPDTELDKAMDRYIVTATIWAHA